MKPCGSISPTGMGMPTKGTNTHKGVTKFGMNESGMKAKKHSMASGKSGYGATKVAGMRQDCHKNGKQY